MEQMERLLMRIMKEYKEGLYIRRQIKMSIARIMLRLRNHNDIAKQKATFSGGLLLW